MAEWGRKHRRMMEHITHALDEADSPLTETQLWNLVARTYSPEWAAASAELQDALQQISIHESPENIALGAIGKALQSPTTNGDEQRHATALASFTVIDETLRSDPDLGRLMKTLHAHSQALEALSSAIAKAVDDFAEAAAPPHRREQRRMQEQALLAAPLRGAFKLAQNLLKRTPSAAKTSTGPRQKTT